MATLTLHAHRALGIRPPGALRPPSMLSRVFLMQGGNGPFLHHPDFPGQEPDSAPCGCPGCTLTSTPWEPSVALSEDGPEPPQALFSPVLLGGGGGDSGTRTQLGNGEAALREGLICVWALHLGLWVGCVLVLRFDPWP